MNKNLDKYGPKCFKTRQARQSRSHVFVDFLPCMWGLGFQNDSPRAMVVLKMVVYDPRVKELFRR